MNRILNLFEPKHYRYLISGILIAFFNWKALELDIAGHLGLPGHSDVLHFLITSSILLIISYPVHKYFTFADGRKDFWIKLGRFLLVGFPVQLLRTGLYVLFNWIGFPEAVSMVLGVAMILLLNFVAFDRFVFNVPARAADRDAYNSGGVGKGILETIEEAVTYNKWIADKIADYLSEKNLEIGAGSGTISAILARDFPLELFEVAAGNRKTLERRFHGNPNVKGIGSDFRKNRKFGKYDCIYSSNVLEHIEDDLSVIAHGIRLLKKGGYFVAFVPAMRILYSPMDQKLGHYRRYDRADKVRIQKFLQDRKLNVRVLRYKFLNPISSLGWFFRMRLLGATQIRRSDAMMMNSILPFVSFLDLLPIPFGQSVLLVIKKW